MKDIQEYFLNHVRRKILLLITTVWQAKFYSGFILSVMDKLLKLSFVHFHPLTAGWLPFAWHNPFCPHSWVIPSEVAELRIAPGRKRWKEMLGLACSKHKMIARNDMLNFVITWCIAILFSSYSAKAFEGYTGTPCLLTLRTLCFFVWGRQEEDLGCMPMKDLQCISNYTYNLSLRTDSELFHRKHITK